ncbi:Methyltransf-25 domain-containing protein [Mycena sanguinolenta]|uniref:Methyltransf-25 domain-containing protein n=1 Tax=Mycena sanguinolenta TaxID=230812 RepID=A0A8H7D136_9AGAR|nr:Methyltransf-25 domain-containing protein [Mycena sanguinolenta]
MRYHRRLSRYAPCLRCRHPRRHPRTPPLPLRPPPPPLACPPLPHHPNPPPTSNSSPATPTFGTFAPTSTANSESPASGIDPSTPIAEASSGPWSRQRAASRDLERVFERMLARKYGMHTRPADMLVPVLARVFCGGNGKGREAAGRVEKPASMHLKLAPVGIEGRQGVTVVGEPETPTREGGEREH